jgi:hypothetical protein
LAEVLDTLFPKLKGQDVEMTNQFIAGLRLAAAAGVPVKFN